MLPTWMLLKLQTVLQMAYNKQAEKSQIIINATKGPDVNRGLFMLYNSAGKQLFRTWVWQPETVIYTHGLYRQGKIHENMGYVR